MKIDPSPVLEINTTLADWITATSWEEQFSAYWQKRLEKKAEEKEGRASRNLQYEGRKWNLEGGTGFLGVAIINGRTHWMLRLSGPAANENIESVLSQVRQGFVTVTRLDLQITVLKPKDWSQWELLKRLKSAGRTTGWVESRTRGEAYETVYVGSRGSNRFARIYTKKAVCGRKEKELTMLLRTEIEYKGRRAHAIAKSLSKTGMKDAKSFMAYELQNTLSDDKLRKLFEPHLFAVAPKTIRLALETTADKTEAWLLKQVLPSFSRHINDHMASGRALDGFMGAINDALGRKE